MLSNDVATCLCRSGYTGKPGVKGGCRDIDECAINPCPQGAICNNEPGSFSCQCPSGTTGDPYSGGCQESKAPHVCGPSTPCPAGEQCIKDEFVGSSVCICQRGYTRDHESGKCRDINECMELRDKPACGVNAICKNLPGSYECQCPPGFNGNPFSLCEGNVLLFLTFARFINTRKIGLQCVFKYIADRICISNRHDSK